MQSELQLKFRTNSKLEKLIGRELITNNTIAFFELIKNSYDAGARKVEVNFFNITEYEVRQNKNGINEFYINDKKISGDTIVSSQKTSIVISDNGHGMSFDEVKKYWMEIGVVHKELKRTIEIPDINVDNMIKRILNGEKGIGRFGADKLGAKLKLVSVNNQGNEKTTVIFDWEKYDDHSTLLQDVGHEYSVEQLKHRQESGLTLNIDDLRDEWSIKEIESLKKQLKKFISPFSQEQSNFSIIVGLNSRREKILNDAFEYTHTYITGAINKEGLLEYTLVDNQFEMPKELLMPSPTFGPVQFKIVYMDRAAKIAFSKRTGLSTREYGNIKVFRDNFRVFPYGEAENDWLGIDNMHAQAVFRSLGTRDIVGYVQISNMENYGLKDATNRLGLVEDTKEFGEFKEFIWKCINLLQSYIFNKIKDSAEKQGNIIDFKTKEGKASAEQFKTEVVEVLSKANIPKQEARTIIKLIEQNNKKIQKDYDEVKKANLELSKKIKVFQRISGTEGILYELLHTIKNKTAILDAQLMSIMKQAERQNINFNQDTIKNTLKSINKLLNGALRKASTSKLNKHPEIFTDIILESIEENQSYKNMNNIKITTQFNDVFQRVNCNKESIKIVFDNFFNNAVKAMIDKDNKEINISTYKVDNILEVYIQDNGFGIKDEDAPFIFNVGFTSTGGNGIGLATSLDIIQEHNGDIQVCSFPENESGACFLIKLPVFGS
ncbi:Histidine kinase-, DNA gyrase B-, and HSP90-like ATPase [Paenibacillus algorifonticola]|uniref:histidine kinase n=1 Tax=Paenibacillus algorifonticola TaxID=684063 RepID=A0A1I2H4K5_9BACL|nr:ATP-binding protein [Paenibacillus algorifonticola]SFF23927.1 Histidine kinase-, DNA gyrase B-, and HSP90-like ATPase [Paenibacillus algorifonticola]